MRGGQLILWFGIAIAPLLLFLILPWLILFASGQTRATVNQQLFLYQQSAKLSIANQDSLSVLLWELVAKQMHNPRPDELVTDTGWVHVYRNRIGSCDQQSLILIKLAASYGIEGRLVFLYGSDSVSRHSVAELKTNNRWVMFDPYYGVAYSDLDGKKLGVEDLCSYPEYFKIGHRLNIANHEIPAGLNYAELFDRKYPYRYFTYNTLSPSAKGWYRLIRLYSKIFGPAFDSTWQGSQGEA